MPKTNQRFPRNALVALCVIVGSASCATARPVGEIAGCSPERGSVPIALRGARLTFGTPFAQWVGNSLDDSREGAWLASCRPREGIDAQRELRTPQDLQRAFECAADASPIDFTRWRIAVHSTTASSFQFAVEESARYLVGKSVHHYCGGVTPAPDRTQHLLLVILPTDRRPFEECVAATYPCPPGEPAR